MSKKSKKIQQEKSAAKKAAVLGNAKKSRLPMFAAIFANVLPLHDPEVGDPRQRLLPPPLGKRGDHEIPSW